MKKILIGGLLLAAALISCREGKGVDPGKDGEKAVLTEPTEEITAAPQEDGMEEPDPVPVPRVAADLSFLQANSSLEPAEAHAKYLADGMDFLIPGGDEPKRTAVVGSRVARFYPDGELVTGEDLAHLPEGVDLPFSAVIPITGKVENSDGKYYGFFEFEENYNYFYRTEWEGRMGLVFGADLAGVNASPDKNRITSFMYENGSRYEQFPYFIGYYPLDEGEKASLEENRLAFQRVLKKEYRLSIEEPDDMISLYMRTARDRYTPLFVSTDLIAQSLHLFFDKYLQYLEEEVFMARLERLVDGYLASLDDEAYLPGDGDSPYATLYGTVRNYFLVAQCLLKLAPEKIVTEDRWGEKTVEYAGKDRDGILAAYPEIVGEEVRLILEGSGQTLSPALSYKEDYSQYKPRGHYTKNGILETYFRAMMWFGRIHFYMSDGRDPIVSDAAADYAQDRAESLSLKTLPMVGLITEITAGNDGLYADWKALFDPITSLIGMSDDLSFYESIPFFEGLPMEDIRVWSGDLEQVRGAVLKAGEELRPPAISGNSVWEAPSGEGRTPPLGWRLFGQRFTWDSYVHQLVSPPRLMSRDVVRGLDIMKAFGSETADQLLAESDYPRMEGLEGTLDALEEEFAGKEGDFWSSSYYNSTLSMIRSQARFEPGTGLFFTESPYWGIKSLLSAHGTWAALRHDTILYVKQVYAERAGDGDFDPTFRTEPLPEPVHYLEPNVPFYEAALRAVAGIEENQISFGLTEEAYGAKIRSWKTLLVRMRDIALLEYRDEAVSDRDVEWIRTIPQQLAPLVSPPDVSYATYVDDEDLLKGAIVADVFTNAELNAALEVGTGIPYRMLVPLNDGQGRKRIAVGYTYSYYEFLVNQSERMTNEEWRSIVYPGDRDMGDYLPFWEQGIALDPR